MTPSSINTGTLSPDFVSLQLIDTIGRDRLTGARRIPQLLGLVRQIYRDVHGSPHTNRSNATDFEAFKRIITCPSS